MFRIALLALAALAATATPAAAAERRFTVTDYDRVVVEGPYRIRLDTGRPPSATASGSPQALDGVAIDVQGRTLRVRPNRSAWSASPAAAAGPVTIILSAHEIRAASVVGAAQLDLGRVSGLRIDLSLQGTGRLSAREVAADRLNLILVGSGRMELAGTAGDLRADVRGWADLDAAALRAEATILNTDTAGRIALTAGRQATITAAGTGDIEIAGTPACTVTGAAAGQVRCGR
jgi:hypothetical protein